MKPSDAIAAMALSARDGQLSVVNPDSTRDLRPEVMDEAGRMRILPAAFWAGTTRDERALLGNRTGVYSFPTTELVEWLRDFIDGRSAIEIGAGHGVLADALGIPGTDNRMQEIPEIAAHYRRTGQPTVTYGPNIIRADAGVAVRRYRPKVVIACWVTHRYDPRNHEAHGNMYGVDEAAILDVCHDYVFIGNDLVHARKPILSRPHMTINPPWLYSRALNPSSRDFIAVWSRLFRA